MDATTYAPDGLTDDEAARLLAEHGWRGELPEPKPRFPRSHPAGRLAGPLSVLPAEARREGPARQGETAVTSREV